MKKIVLLLVSAAVMLTVCSAAMASEMKTPPATKPAEKKSAFTNDVDKLSYAIGYQIGRSMKNDNIRINLQVFTKAIEDVLKGRELAMSQDEIKETIMGFQKEMMAKSEKLMKETAEKNEAEGKKFFEANAKKPGVKVLPSGLQYKVIKEGTGENPKATDKVKVKYKGTLINGKEFDSTEKYGGQPLTIGVGNVIPGWSEALQLMKVGSKWEIYIPAKLGYGDRGAGPMIPPGSALIFEVELLGIEKAPTTEGAAPK